MAFAQKPLIGRTDDGIPELNDRATHGGKAGADDKFVVVAGGRAVAGVGFDDGNAAAFLALTCLCS